MTPRIEDIHSIRRRETEESASNVVLTFDNTQIQIPLRFIQYVDLLHSRIKALEKGVEALAAQSPLFVNVPDNVAEQMIIAFIRTQQKQEKMEIDVLDISYSLKLPYDQIGRVMEKLKTRGMREID